MFLYILEEIYENGNLKFVNFYSINLRHNLRVLVFDYDFRYFEKRREAALNIWKKRRGEKISEEEQPIDKMLNEEYTINLIRTIAGEASRAISSEIFHEYILKNYKAKTALDLFAIGLDGLMWVVTPKEKILEAIKVALEKKKDILIHTKFSFEKGIESVEIKVIS